MRANEQIAELLVEWAELLGISGAEGFRVRAYEKAAQAVETVAEDIGKLDDKGILALAGVGKNMASRIREFLDTGSIRELEDLREVVPAGLRDLLRLPGLGPKKAMLLHEKLGVSSITELTEAVAAHRLRDIKGLGAKTEVNLAHAIERFATSGQRIHVDKAAQLAESMVEALRAACAIDRVQVAGSVRRGRDSVGDIDLLVTAPDPVAVIEAFTSLPVVADVIAHGETKSSILVRSGTQIDLRVIPDDAWGAALIYFTGSKAHNVALRQIAIKAGKKLSEWGLFDAASGSRVAAGTEEEVYAALGMAWIPPTLREDSGEIDAAINGRLPTLVRQEQIRGDLHTHTDWTDGMASLEEMVAAAAQTGYEYYAVTDHGEDLPMTGMSRTAVEEQRKALRAMQSVVPDLVLLHGCELNIGKQGSVDYDNDFLSAYDLTVASVHSHFAMSTEQQTARIIEAMKNPFVNIIGHLTGRQIGRRDPIALDFGAVCEAAVLTGTALEVNAYPDRLDLMDSHVRYAVSQGVTLVIDTDAHAVKHLTNMRFGVATAQRGWAEAPNVLNTMGVQAIREFVAAKRP